MLHNFILTQGNAVDDYDMINVDVANDDENIREGLEQAETVAEYKRQNLVQICTRN